MTRAAAQWAAASVCLHSWIIRIECFLAALSDLKRCGVLFNEVLAERQAPMFCGAVSQTVRALRNHVERSSDPVGMAARLPTT